MAYLGLASLKELCITIDDKCSKEFSDNTGLCVCYKFSFNNLDENMYYLWEKDKIYRWIKMINDWSYKK